jgi:hypothetical protein
MANRRFEQFQYSLVKKLTHICGSATYDAAAAASLVVQDLTYTADAVGAAGNDITIAYVDTGTAGSEVVNVTGNAIEVEIESGVSTATQVKTAIDASAPASALISVAISGTAGDAQVTAAETNLAGGDDADFDVFDIPGVASVDVSGTGLVKVTLQDKYNSLMYAHCSIQKASAADLVAQVTAEDVNGDKEIDFSLLAGATPTNLANGDVLYFDIKLRNSSVS